MHKGRQLLWATVAGAWLVPHGLGAQVPGAAEPSYKGIFEPVNYSEDLRLTDVFFVDKNIGWVAAAAGTLLHTRDGGQTWTAQLGGDVQSQEPPIERLRFLDDSHGWALQPTGIGQYRLLRTADGGERWEQVGRIEARWGLVGYQFTTPTDGVYVDGNDNVARIVHTSDGGRAWREVFPSTACVSSLELQGLRRQTNCRIRALHMVSPRVGYAVGDYGSRAPDALAVLKTEDGGATWNLWAVPDAGDVRVPVGTWQELFFLDERVGFVQVGSVTGATKLLTTEDGGQTWRAIAGSAGRRITFADPQVGWSFDRFAYGTEYVLHYTTDGGSRWTSRSLRFPAELNAFSLPRRDLGYVVGNHGMIYRYRVVEVGYTAANTIDAPAMPRR